MPAIFPRSCSPSLRLGLRSTRPVRRCAASLPAQRPLGPAHTAIGKSSRVTPASPSAPGTRPPAGHRPAPGDQSCSSLPSTQPRSSALTASFAAFGRSARSSARTCAASARYRPVPVLFLPISRLTVDGARPSPAAITRTPAPPPPPPPPLPFRQRQVPPPPPAPFPATPPASRNHPSASPWRTPAASAARRSPRPGPHTIPEHHPHRSRHHRTPQLRHNKPPQMQLLRRPNELARVTGPGKW